MKVHELVEQYKQIMRDAELEHQRSLQRIRRDTAYLQSRDPMMDVAPPLWDDYSKWCEKQEVKQNASN